MESSDNFQNGKEYSLLVQYNFGSPLTIDKQLCYLVSGDEVYFDEFFILSVLNSMDSRNKISYFQNSGNKTITITG